MTRVLSTPETRLRVSVAVLLVLYAVGAWGMTSEHRARFVALSFLNLVTTAALLLINAQRVREPFGATSERRAELGLDRGAALSFLISALFGFCIELVGVSTGWPFGVYTYTEHLGPRGFGVPLVIGLNWATLVHATQAVLAPARQHGLSPGVCAALGASLMTAFDALLEPAAISLRFWVWSGDRVPVANYVAWWCISLGLLRLGFALSPRLRNPAAAWVLGVQVVFFWWVVRGP